MLFRYKLGIRQNSCALFTNLHDSSNFRKLLKEEMISIWQDRWNQSSKGRITFEFITNVRFALECNYFKFSLFTGFLLTGHGSLNEYLHKRGLASPPVVTVVMKLRMLRTFSVSVLFMMIFVI